MSIANNKKPIVVTFINKNYIDLFDIFYNNIIKHNVNLLVVCLDGYTRNELACKNIPTLYRPFAIIPGNHKSKKTFWRYRVSVINDIYTQYKTDLIHTDVDCFWLKDITNVLYENNKYDLVAHIAYNHPHYIAEKQGFVMCCGLYYIKYTNKAENFAKNVRDYMEVLINNPGYPGDHPPIDLQGDDQVMFNHYMFNYIGVKTIQKDWNKSIPVEMTLNNNMTVGIINNNIISRTYNENLYCFHPYFENYTPSRYSQTYIQEKYPLLKK